MLNLENVTLWACVWTPDEAWIDKTFRVVRHCARLAKFGEVIFFCCKDPSIDDDCGWTIVRIPQLDMKKWNIFINREIPKHIRTAFCMSVHEDGFIIDTSLWSYDFLSYDYIGAPWPGGLVGNQGFCIESKKMLQEKIRLPKGPNDSEIPSDVFICNKHRTLLETRGIRFAPTAIAEKFSTEMYGDDQPSFGFHGRTVAHRKYALGWKQIEKMESEWDSGSMSAGSHLPSVLAPRMSGKICITTTFDRNYAMGGKTMMKSIRHYTDCAGIDFKVITGDEIVLKEFGPEHCHFVNDEIKDRYKNVQYSKELPPEKYSQSWYRYELFNFKGYDRVICIDSDCLCVSDMSYLFSEELNEFDIISVEDHIVSKCFIHFVPELLRQGLNFKTLNQRKKEGKIDIQPALIVANRRVVNEEWYKRLIHYANTTGFTYSIDEGILNDFIYKDNLRVKLLPLEYDYQDLYEIHCPELPVPSQPVIVHCQESKPWKKDMSAMDARMHKWHYRWWYEHNVPHTKTVVVIIVYNRFHNLELWLNAWRHCKRAHSELVVVHNLESDNQRYEALCLRHHVQYVPRKNVGFDMGAFQDVCKKRLKGFPNDWDNLIWITDDCLPTDKNFVEMYIRSVEQGNIPCYEISDEVKRHIRTTGFLITKEIAPKLVFPADPIIRREDCYVLEHRGFNLYEQITQMGLRPAMVVPDLRESPLWDSGCRAHLQLMQKHIRAFPST